ncbi:MAG: DUF4351 domain-containing protein [Nannocystaceae bacterium]
MSIAKQTLEELSRDPATRRPARDRDDAHKLHLMEQAYVRKEAIEQGEAKVLLKQLQLRFGSLPEATRALVENAKSEQLDIWVERVLTAKSLDEVFAE